LAGANLIYGAGMLEMGMTLGFGQMVIDNEIARMIKHTVNGMPVNDETLAVDVIKEIGPFKDFLSHEHTLQHMKIHSQPKFIDRRMREDWESMGKVGMCDKADEAAKFILETHQPKALSEKVQIQLRSIVEGAEKELVCY
jgi:trimethylamine--corrinoid protein Co-methyltransferase